MRKIFNKKGQNTAEYAIIISLVIAAALAMQIYVKRGVQGRVRDASDKFATDLSSNADWNSLNAVTVTSESQYEPNKDKFSSQATQETLTGTKEETTMEVGGKVTRESVERTKQAGTAEKTGAGRTGKADYQRYDY